MRRLSLTLVAVASVLAAPSASPGATAGSELELTLTKQRKDVGLTACGKWHRHAWYREGDRVAFTGRATEIPAGTRVRIVVRRCLDGRYRPVLSLSVRVRADGTFRGSFPVGEPSDCFVRAKIGTLASQRRYFHVTGS